MTMNTVGASLFTGDSDEAAWLSAAEEVALSWIVIPANFVAVSSTCIYDEVPF